MKVKNLLKRKFPGKFGLTKVSDVRKCLKSSDTLVITDSWKHPEKVDNWLKSFGESDFQAGGLHQSIYPILIIAQFFGILPVNNISAKSPTQLSFNFISFRVAYAIFTTAVAAFLTLCCIAYLIESSIMFGKIVYLVFNMTSLFSFICFIRLALNWSTIMIEWQKVEKNLPTFETSKKKYQNRLKMRCVAASILTLSMVEHILSIVSVASVVWDCPKIQNIYQAYMVRSFPIVFYFFPYSIPLSILVKFGHITSTFIWSFTDLFIMLISMGLSSLFDRINERMIRVKGKVRMELS